MLALSLSPPMPPPKALAERLATLLEAELVRRTDAPLLLLVPVLLLLLLLLVLLVLLVPLPFLRPPPALQCRGLSVTWYLVRRQSTLP